MLVASSQIIIMIFYNNPTRTALPTIIAHRFAKVVVNQYKFLVDFQGLMFFDDAQVHRNPKNQIRDRKFIQKFYQSLRQNKGEHADAYPYMGEFWGERNYLRYSISPIIYTALAEGHLEFSMGLKVPFQPALLHINADGHFCYPYETANTTISGIFSNRLTASLLPMVIHSEDGLKLRLGEEQHVIGHVG